MRRIRRLLLFFAVGVVLAGTTFIRVGYKSLGWGGYIYVGVAAPWKR